jgi:phosphopantothenoylcysteine decarboxylase/phosphopantothenate--cysteine ligase
MRILITAGPTREHIDAVRFISNRSSGRMGYALARSAMERMHDVILVSGPVAIDPPPAAKIVRIVSAQEMYRAVHAEVIGCDALIMAAAVCDIRPEQKKPHKLKKEKIGASIPIESNPDILASLRENKGGRLHVGFAAQTGELIDPAQEKLAAKGLDMIVANPVDSADSGFESSRNKGVILFRDGSRRTVELTTKTQMSAIILEELEKLKLQSAH